MGPRPGGVRRARPLGAGAEPVRRTVEVDPDAGYVRQADQVVELNRKRAGDGEVYQISGARPGLTDDVRGRQRRYAISMGIRTVCVLLAVSLWHVQTVFAAIALVGGIVVPYVAVVIANAGRSNRTPTPPSFVPGPTRNVLEPGQEPHAVGETPRGEDEQLPDHRD